MSRLTRSIAGLAGWTLLAAAPLAAQERERTPPPSQEVPKGFEPPRGMCRIWLTGVPPAQQPAPTDCATAIRKRPANGRVIFGERVRESESAGSRERVPVKELGPVRIPRPPEVGPPQTRPPDYEELLAHDRWLDEELLAALYDDPGGRRARSLDPRATDGRATPPPAIGERGRVRSGSDPRLDERRLDDSRLDERRLDDRLLEWAYTAGGTRLAASEVERLLRLERALLLGGDPTEPVAAGFGRVAPRECYDRDFDGRCDDVRTGADGCYDRNRDGRCDDLRYDPPPCPRGARCDDGYGRAGGYDGRYDDRYDDPRRRGGEGSAYGICFDRDRDGRCDEPWSDGRRIPQTLPEMRAATGLQRGVPSYDVERWLRRSDLQARVSRDRSGVIRRVVWLDPAGQVVQVWTDRTGDGIANRVELFRDGLPVQVIER